MADDQGAGSQEGVEVAASPASTSASSSTSDLPCIAPPEAERHAGGRRHSSRSFTGLRLFGRRSNERTLEQNHIVFTNQLIRLNLNTHCSE
ncbi:hypothetical protein PHYPO_G00147390 [Pangasianodon hypophthalmus]|uniref:Uncharacterized protein n=1 Tax=Pangasianodon hypophthalmus TaxID=310915 RepID=A0A5N5K945_PANHP|nr:hypothetical protein PHYPO_G00147390 [Pangasianodon hypophthalmus]